jgi:hypothetical protein
VRGGAKVMERIARRERNKKSNHSTEGAKWLLFFMARSGSPKSFLD